MSSSSCSANRGSGVELLTMMIMMVVVVVVTERESDVRGRNVEAEF